MLLLCVLFGKVICRCYTCEYIHKNTFRRQNFKHNQKVEFNIDMFLSFNNIFLKCYLKIMIIFTALLKSSSTNLLTTRDLSCSGQSHYLAFACILDILGTLLLWQSKQNRWSSKGQQPLPLLFADNNNPQSYKRQHRVEVQFLQIK